MFRFSHFEVGIGLERGGGIFWKSTRAEREASCQNLPVGDGDNHLMLLKPDMDMGKLVLLVVHIQHRQIPFACSKALNGTAFDAAGIWQRGKPRRGKPEEHPHGDCVGSPHPIPGRALPDVQDRGEGRAPPLRGAFPNRPAKCPTHGTVNDYGLFGNWCGFLGSLVIGVVFYCSNPLVKTMDFQSKTFSKILRHVPCLMTGSSFWTRI